MVRATEHNHGQRLDTRRRSVSLFPGLEKLLQSKINVAKGIYARVSGPNACATWRRAPSTVQARTCFAPGAMAPERYRCANNKRTGMGSARTSWRLGRILVIAQKRSHTRQVVEAEAWQCLDWWEWSAAVIALQSRRMSRWPAVSARSTPYPGGTRS